MTGIREVGSPPPVAPLICKEAPPLDAASAATWEQSKNVDGAVHAAVTQAIHTVASAFSVASDPETLLEALEVARRDQMARADEFQIHDASSRAEQAEKARRAAIKKAKQASGFLGLGKVLGGLLKAVAVAAAAAASAITGGTAGALAIAGLALMLGADKISEAAVKLGIIDKADAKWLSLGLQIAGALLSCGSGLASGAASAGAGASTAAGSTAANAAGQTAANAEDIVKVIHATTEALGAVNGGAMSAVRFDQAGHQIDGKRFGAHASKARAEAEASTEDLKDLMQSFARTRERFASVHEARNEARMACVRTPA